MPSVPFVGKILAVSCALTLAFASISAGEEAQHNGLTLRDAVDLALKNNPGLKIRQKGVEEEGYRISAARGERLPALALDGGATRYRYAQPITPITGFPTQGAGFPKFDETIYDFGVSMTLPIYRGGRIERGIEIAELRKSLAEDSLFLSRQELVYDITSVYCKIGTLEKLLEANSNAVKELEEQRKDVEIAVKAGTAPKLDLLKADVELSHARQSVLAVKNSIENAYALLKTFMGIDMDKKIAVESPPPQEPAYPATEEAFTRALMLRPDYRALMKRKRIAEEEVKNSEGKRWPQVNLNGEYGGRSGADADFRETWFLGLRLTLPVFDGGVISSEVGRLKVESEAISEEERALRNEIRREIKDAYLGIEDSDERITVARSALEAARENLRVERLRFRTGSGTTADVIAAETALLRSETDYYQAYYDRALAGAALEKAVGEDIYKEVAAR